MITAIWGQAGHFQAEKAENPPFNSSSAQLSALEPQHGNFLPQAGTFKEPDPIYFLAMLLQLTIQNYATVDSLEIDFKPGMSVITGETGAGKSIILGALGLTLGDRADKTVIRSGASKTDISAEFDISKISSAQQWLNSHDLESGNQAGECILRRVVNEDGRSKGYINGTPVTMANLKALGEMLIDIHSQHEHQSLLHRSTHLRLLDEFGVDSSLLDDMRKTWKSWQKNFQDMQGLSAQAQENSAETQLLSYQLSELVEMGIEDNEAEKLESEFKTLNNADGTIASVQTALNLCEQNDEKNIVSMLVQVLASLRELEVDQKPIPNIIKLLETAEIQIQEAVTDLRAYGDEFDANPERLEQINARLSALHGVARKHKIKPAELSQFIATLNQQLNRFQNSDEELEKLLAEDEVLRSEFKKLASKISSNRKKAASKLAKQVNTQLKQLGMPNATLEIQLQPVEANQPNQNGQESVEFLVSTNPGQEAKPLIKIASGGELSRISLAIQVITAQTSHTPSLVFDEVDVGIGGGVAIVVGELLRKLGESAQILCVTHQAQVAGQGHNHYFVSKDSDRKSTLTKIEELGGGEKIKEVARMLSGDGLSDESLAHAEQMVANS